MLLRPDPAPHFPSTGFAWKFLAALGGFGLLVLLIQIGLIYASDSGQASWSSLSLLSAVFAYPDTGFPELVFSLIFGISCILLSTVASAALALPLTTGLRLLQRLALGSLMLLSMGWQLLSLGDYMSGIYPGPAVLLILGVLALCAALLLRSRPRANRYGMWTVGFLMTVMALLASLIIAHRLSVRLNGQGSEITQTLLVLLFGLGLVGLALRLREKDARMGRASWKAAIVFQFWLLTVWMPNQYLLND